MTPSRDAEAIADRIRGALYGQAIGDALGLGAEFMSRAEVKKNYPDRLLNYDQIIQDEHRLRWPRGAWTDDTDQALCILDSLLTSGDPQVDVLDVAARIKAWADGGGMGIGRTVRRALDRHQFDSDPHAAALQVWIDSRGRAAANGGLMRTSVLGVWTLSSAELTAYNAAQACRVTHFDPRCVASCVVLCEGIRSLVMGEEDIGALLDRLCLLGATFDHRVEEVFDLAIHNCVDDLRLDEGLNPDERDRFGYTFKALGAAIWALTHCTEFDSGLLAVIHAGGDADTNAAIVGALLGARLGLSKIPPPWVEGLLDREAFDARVEAVVARAPGAGPDAA